MTNVKLTVEGKLEGSETIEEAITRLGSLGQDLESFAGRGYKFNGPVINGTVLLKKPDATAMTDREKLSAAFMELERDHGFAAPVSLAWEADCLYHASKALEEKYDEEVTACVFWFSERDDYAFGFPGYSSYVKSEYEGIETDEAKAEWAYENVELITSSEISERLQHNTLVRPLWLFWVGDSNLIISVLKKNGLRCDDSVVEGECIYVYPSVKDAES